MRKRICVPMMTLCILLGGCGGRQAAEEQSIRQTYRDMVGCIMEADVACGVGTDEVLIFSLRCAYTAGGTHIVEVLAPEEVAGICAVINGDELSVIYQDLCLPAGTLSRAELSPAACLPWLMDALRDGWLLEQSREAVGDVPCVRLCLDESAGQVQVESALWLREADGIPVRGELSVDGEIILTAEFTDFRFCDTINNQVGETAADTGGTPGTRHPVGA